ncbi:sensor histidine kinase [Calothrix sp. 336/3]|uniref:sensor histidine kinase n=1 Tax=Calothrix sp. 336/3 TaxID=1337936 RepID=UPI0004E42C61|nr:HAMP domain-containing sensor histidine kinase [Calothrix sp. 336/3]AKG22873.1 ATPase [Calothrix sp. 336/3]
MNILQILEKRLDFFSLRLRLTLGIAAFSLLGIGGFTLWTNWKMQQILIGSHKHDIEQMLARLPRDVEVYSEMMSLQTGLKKSLNYLANDSTFLWVKNSPSRLVLKSNNWSILPENIAQTIINISQDKIRPNIYKIEKKYFVVCSRRLIVKKQDLGEVIVVKDISHDQKMFLMVVQSLTIGSVCLIVIICGAVTIYIYAALKPLRQLSRMTQGISFQDLSAAKIKLDKAPSEVKELADTYNKMLSGLNLSWEQEKQFVSNVSHELRTPLTIVNGYLQSVLRRENNLTEMQREALKTASMEAERTIRLLQDLLDLARADSGNFPLNIENCCLGELVNEVIAMARQYSDRSIILETVNLEIWVKVDYSRLKQVLINLIDNAIKYSPPDAPVVVKLSQREKMVTIEVCDRGYGIPLQHQSRIFERFYRVDESRNSNTGGTGLGLAIVKTFVEGMGGSVTVRSRMGEGSVFIVNLPS